MASIQKVRTHKSGVKPNVHYCIQGGRGSNFGGFCAYVLDGWTHDGKYIQLDFSQNLALQAKDNVQAAHFAGKQFTLHCAIVERVKFRYHYHIIDYTKHDSVFVDHVIRDIIVRYHRCRLTVPRLSITSNMHSLFTRN